MIVARKQINFYVKGLFNDARSIERGSNADISEALVNFGSCMNTDQFKDLTDRPHEGCVKSFIERVYACAPIANDHPYCREDHPSYNAISCAIKLNQCLIESLDGIFDDC